MGFVPQKSKSKTRKEGQPKRATTAFMLWLNDTRESIKKDNPGIKVTEIAKKGGEMWGELKDKSVSSPELCLPNKLESLCKLFSSRFGRQKPTRTRSGMRKR